MYYDPLGGVAWVEDTDWHDTDGKHLMGSELAGHLSGHGSGASYLIATDDIEDGAVTNAKTSEFDDF